MSVQQVLASLDWGTLVVAILTAIVAAWVAAWANNQYERGRLIEMWRQERSKETLNCVKEYVHRVLQGSTLAPYVHGEERQAVMNDAIRASGSMLAIAFAIDDKELGMAAATLFDAAAAALQRIVGPTEPQGEDEEKPSLTEAASVVLKRCGELLEETSSSKPWWKRHRLVGR